MNVLKPWGWNRFFAGMPVKRIGLLGGGDLTEWFICLNPGLKSHFDGIKPN
jgi:hypothetical protein